MLHSTGVQLGQAGCWTLSALKSISTCVTVPFLVYVALRDESHFTGIIDAYKCPFASLKNELFCFVFLETLAICITVPGLHRSPVHLVNLCFSHEDTAICKIFSYPEHLHLRRQCWDVSSHCALARVCNTVLQFNKGVFMGRWKGLSPTFGTLQLKLSCSWAYWSHRFTFRLK